MPRPLSFGQSEVVFEALAAFLPFHLLGVVVMPSEAGTSWADFPRALACRERSGVTLVISDPRQDLITVTVKVLAAS